MNLKRDFRLFALLLVIGLLAIGLTSCRLPASMGPQTDKTPGDGFPVPGETKETNVIDVAKFATQTAQARPPVVITPVLPPPSPTPPGPIVTKAPTPTATATQFYYVVATPGGPPEAYTLLEGEYPFCIARRFDVSQQELLDLNNLTPDSFFYKGEVLKIPQTGTPFQGTRTLQDHPTTYTVEEGDTLGSIACSFGDVSPDMIALQNNISVDETLATGSKLVIP